MFIFMYIDILHMYTAKNTLINNKTFKMSFVFFVFSFNFKNS